MCSDCKEILRTLQAHIKLKNDVQWINVYHLGGTYRVSYRMADKKPIYSSYPDMGSLIAGLLTTFRLGV